MSVFTQSHKDKYAGLPKNYRGEIHTVFEEKTGKPLRQYLAGASIMTPRQLEVFNTIVDEYVDTYKNQLQEL